MGSFHEEPQRGTLTYQMDIWRGEKRRIGQMTDGSVKGCESGKTRRREKEQPVTEHHIFEGAGAKFFKAGN